MSSQSMPLGVVLERRETDHPWEPVAWTAVAVIANAPAPDGWREVERGAGWVRYHAATLALDIHRKDTEGYKYNLGNTPPRVYLVLRYDDDAEHGIVPFLATACPYEAQAYLDGDEDLVESVTMPEIVAQWLGEFVEQHHVDEPHYKRERKPHTPAGADGNPRGRAAR